MVGPPAARRILSKYSAGYNPVGLFLVVDRYSFVGFAGAVGGSSLMGVTVMHPLPSILFPVCLKYSCRT